MKRQPPQLDKPYPRHRGVLPEEAELWQAEGDSGFRIRDSGKKVLSKVAKRKAPHPPVPSPQPRLDLHGHTQASAHAALVRFIEAAQEQGLRSVLVITGKGRNGQPGVLRTQVPRWLAESPLRGRISGYDSASPRQGGEGAWVVRIKKVLGARF